MNRIPSLACLVVGIILIVYDANASDSLSSDFSRFFTGTPTDRAIWLILGGAAAAIIGTAGLLRGPRTR